MKICLIYLLIYIRVLYIIYMLLWHVFARVCHVHKQQRRQFWNRLKCEQTYIVCVRAFSLFIFSIDGDGVRAQKH